MMLARNSTGQVLARFARPRPDLPLLRRSQLKALLLAGSATPAAAKPSIRHISTQKITPEASTSLLASQRLHRPVSPHLSIYRPQITWYASMLNRITGSVLSGAFYLFFTAYLIAPVFGWHLESASLAASAATLPLAAKAALKFVAALPFTFHSWNGVRHLVWDLGLQMANVQVMRTGWAVVGLSLVSSAALAAWFDLDRSGSCMLVRMAKAPHEFLISALSHEIKRQLKAIGNDQTTTMVVRENARAIEELRNTTLNLPGSQRSPDNSFQHVSAVQPDVVLEVASSQHEKCLKKMAREYLATTAGRIHVVIGVKLYSGATKAAKISVWRSSWITPGPDGGRRLKIVKDPVDQFFRDNDGLPVAGALRLHLSDFVPLESAAGFEGALNPLIEIPFRLLHDALDEGERRDEQTRMFRPPPLDYSVVEESSDSSHDERTASDELVVQRALKKDDEHRAELPDPSYIE
ncbi:MAG: hypothetical protein M1826_002416 [Phylliscum demangeonii]|nr:MAG: hypothetical protein M1826_002416 [Phylliscum demangeonii]